MEVDLEMTDGMPARMKWLYGGGCRARLDVHSERRSRRADSVMPELISRNPGEAVWHKTGPVFSRLSRVSQPTTEVGRLSPRWPVALLGANGTIGAPQD